MYLNFFNLYFFLVKTNHSITSSWFSCCFTDLNVAWGQGDASLQCWDELRLLVLGCGMLFVNIVFFSFVFAFDTHREK